MFDNPAQYIAAIVFVVALMGIAFLLVRTFNITPNGIRKGRRLALVETMMVDKNRKLLLLRRDNKEHLILIGGQQDILVEGNIDIPLNVNPKPTPVEHPAVKQKQPKIARQQQQNQPNINNDQTSRQEPTLNIVGTNNNNQVNQTTQQQIAQQQVRND